MIVSKKILPALARQTAIVAIRNSKQESNQRPMAARQKFIKEISERYKTEKPFDDYLTSLFPLNPPPAIELAQLLAEAEKEREREKQREIEKEREKEKEKEREKEKEKEAANLAPFSPRAERNSIIPKLEKTNTDRKTQKISDLKSSSSIDSPRKVN